jgi:uncharacterized membrane protein
MDGFIGLYFSQQHVFYYAGRFYETLLGAACIPAIYLAGKNLFNKETGLLAALFLAVCSVYVEISQIARGQALAALLVLFALNWSALIWKRGSGKYYIYAWAAAAAAISVRIYCAVVIIPLLFYHVLSSWERLGAQAPEMSRAIRSLRVVFSGKLLLGVVIGLLAFTVCTPQKVLDMGTYIKLNLVNTGVLGGSGSYYFGAETKNGWVYYFFRGFPAASAAVESISIE